MADEESFKHTFTSCGQQGRAGPSPEQCQAAYPDWSRDPAAFRVEGGYQIWRVPHTGWYVIEAHGPSPPSQTYDASFCISGGRGAIVKSTFPLIADEQLTILVGQRPKPSAFSGGAGGTFVMRGSDRSTSKPLIVAGGGGSYRCGCEFSGDAYAIMDAGPDTNGKNSNSRGGTGGQGGQACNGGSSGAGLEGQGVTPGGLYAQSFRCGGVGGLYRGHNGSENEGGFGGGGGGGWGGSGGGGGYSGGGAANDSLFPPSGGGGSFCSGSSQHVSCGSEGCDGEGKVSVTYSGPLLSESFSDTIVLVNGEELSVASQILRLASPVFDAMFSVDMKEASKNRIEVNVVSSKNEFEVFYCWMLPGIGRMVKVTPQNVFYLMSLSDYYQVDMLKTECLEVFAELPASIPALLQARRFHLQDHYERLAQAIEERFEDFDLEALRDHPDIMMDMLLRLQNRQRKKQS
eukprot:TRINITY_DN24102_c0_g2_i1.p1 TRINITY_DN24102_c0_g2~~TRINITY_DN24102_c0_g2_i1.p1  ORF type:complete len:493 (-),score=72.42 TRINITY_DN24102_c0_g2_i1:89-1465(-)